MGLQRLAKSLVQIFIINLNSLFELETYGMSFYHKHSGVRGIVLKIHLLARLSVTPKATIKYPYIIQKTKGFSESLGFGLSP